MDVAVQALALRLQALEDPLSPFDGLVLDLGIRGCPGAGEIGRARLDVADRELELLQPAEGDLTGLVGLAGRPRLRFRPPLVGALEAFDLLTEPADLAAQRVDDALELCVEVIVAR